MSSFLLRLPRRAVGVALLVAGGFAIAAPVVTGEWAVQLLSIPLFLLAVAESYAAFISPELWNKPSAYVPSLTALGASFVLFVSPSLVLNSLPIVLIVVLIADGAFKIVTALARGQRSKSLSLISGVVECGLALLVWSVSRWISVALAIGLAVGGYAAMAGWRMLFMPQAEGNGPATRAAESLHPDEKLGLGPNDAFAALRGRALARSKDPT
jgi:uncharacterized membrane protein HdeD (DUF308 family)